MASNVTMTFLVDESQFETYIDERIAKLSSVGIGALLNGEVFEFLADRVSNRFASGGDSASGPWAPISPLTQSSRKMNASSEPLIDTGTLKDWAENPPGTPMATREGGFSVLDYPNIPPSDSITNYKYLMAQFGIENTFGKQGLKTPPRPIFAVDEVDLSGIMMILLFYILER